MRTLLICFAVTACTNVHADPDRSDASDTRGVAAFHALEIHAAIDVDVTIGSPGKVELRGPAEWIAKLETRVDNGTLTIAMPHEGNHPRLRAVIMVPTLDGIHVSGVSHMHVATLAEKVLEVGVSGVATIDLSGRADTLVVKLSGTGEVRARDLATHDATVGVSGSGNATIRATQDVDVSVSGVGNVTLVGKPANVKKHVSGVGHVHVES
ncbi:MAG TPA: head GIN domain-containing protein [Kofleriaceae bacterium]|nr:head GIN domain-containing protein [Kofleriaceae bacterium]